MISTADTPEANTSIFPFKMLPSTSAPRRSIGGESLPTSRKKAFKTAEEAVKYLFSEELESEMIALPPEEDELTDEEDFDDTETLDPSVRDVICPIICKLT
ncbi:hypothetical protein NPIL_47931 [Nephila pilipes]|uniref:Uncharacterized protein n=1 Tax=Nephila pilipes TaxID=299642 RepID=A0A8X6U913_NEPPI|nr:hypothetical protein NPIL_47931 [Nephila pilipes]